MVTTNAPSTKPRLIIRVQLLLLLPVIAVIAMLLIYCQVESDQSSIYESVNEVPPMPAAIVFGAGINSLEFADRISTAVSLYKSGKVRKLLMTGDNGTSSYNEPIAMKKRAVSMGVPAQDIACDFAGFRTYDSLYRARDIFEVRQAVLVTQRYHLPRALFLAHHLGLNVVGLDAGLHSPGAKRKWYEFREVIASQAAWFDVMASRKPKYLGKKEPLF